MGQLRRENCHAGEMMAEVMSSLGEERQAQGHMGCVGLDRNMDSPPRASGRRQLIWVQTLVGRCACENSLLVDMFSQ